MHDKNYLEVIIGLRNANVMRLTGFITILLLDAFGWVKFFKYSFGPGVFLMDK